MEAQVDERRRCDKRRGDNQPDKRPKRGNVRGGGAIEGRGAGGWEAAA